MRDQFPKSEAVTPVQPTPAAGNVMYGTKQYLKLRFHLHVMRQKSPPEAQARIDNVINEFRDEAKRQPNSSVGFQNLLAAYERLLLPILNPAQQREIQRLLQVARERCARPRGDDSTADNDTRSASPFPQQQQNETAKQPTVQDSDTPPANTGASTPGALPQRSESQAAGPVLSKSQKKISKRSSTAGAGASAEGIVEEEERMPANQKGTRRSGGTKRKKGQDMEDAKFDEAELYLVNIDAGDLDFETETNSAMEAVLRRRRDTGLAASSNELHPLSDWRLAHEIIRHRVIRAHGSSTASDVAVVEGNPGFDKSFLRALQLGFSAFSGNVLRRAMDAARHRAGTTQRPSNFVVTSDPRRGVGAIRRQEEAAAEAKAAAEREALLKAAGSKRADEETKAMAQKAKAELVGQQAAAAANRALAATFGGKHAKWASMAAGASGAKRAKISKDVSKDKTKKQEEVKGGDARPGAGSIDIAAPGLGPDAPEEVTIQLEDLVHALENDPIYCRSSLLYRLLNGLVASYNTHPKISDKK